MNFICGTFFKHQCQHRFTDYIDARTPQFVYQRDGSLDNNWVYCKPEAVGMFKANSDLHHEPFVLVTHNSDVNFTESVVEQILYMFPNLEHWYTQNLLCDHNKVSPIPIGIANPKWSHGNQKRFSKVMSEDLEKNNLFYANFNISTNAPERQYCYQQIGIDPPTKYPNAISIDDHDTFVNSTQEEYLRDISKSFFTISPDGNGKDCHKTWEALYMKSIPIVTDSVFARKFRALGIPILIIQDWDEFRSLKLTPELYNNLWQDFDPAVLTKIFL